MSLVSLSYWIQQLFPVKSIYCDHICIYMESGLVKNGIMCSQLIIIIHFLIITN